MTILSHRSRSLWLGCIIVWAALANWQVLPQTKALTEEQLSAVVLYNIIDHRIWPGNDRLPDTIHVLILNDDPLIARIFEASLKAKEDLFNRVVIHRELQSIQDNRPHFIFFGPGATSRELELLDTTQPEGIATIGVQSNFIKMGGIFQIDHRKTGDDRISFNPDALKLSGVRFKLELLRLAKRQKP